MTVPKEKKFKRIDKNGEEIIKYIYYMLQFIDSLRLMTSPLSNLVNNRSEGIRKIKCKYGYNGKKCEICGFKYKYCDCFLEYKNFKDYLIERTCLFSNRN